MLKPQVSDPLFCPEVAFDPGCPKLTAPPAGYPEFKLWTGETVGTYAKCKVSYDTLRQCWDREQGKRTEAKREND